MPAAASGPGSTLLAGLESLVHGVVGNATALTSSLLARPGYSPATLLAAKTADVHASDQKATDKECTCGTEERSAQRPEVQQRKMRVRECAKGVTSRFVYLRHEDVLKGRDLHVGDKNASTTDAQWSTAPASPRRIRVPAA